MRGCGFAHPPADGTRDREVVDRFRDFLAAIGGPADGKHFAGLSPARRYRVRFLAWRAGQVPR